LPAPERQERLLDDVFGELPATAHPIRERECRPAVALEQHLVGDTVALTDVIGQLLVRQPAQAGQAEVSRGSNHPLLISGLALASTWRLFSGLSKGPSGVTALWTSRPIAAA